MVFTEIANKIKSIGKPDIKVIRSVPPAPTYPKTKEIISRNVSSCRCSRKDLYWSRKKGSNTNKGPYALNIPSKYSGNDLV